MSDDTPDQKPAAAKKPAARKPATRKPAAKPESAATESAATESANPTKPIPAVRPKPASTQPTEVIPPAASASAATTTATAETVPAESVPAESVPAESAAAAAPAEPGVVVVPPKRRRRRWPWVLGAILVVLAILGTIGYVVGENYAKNYARDYIKQRIVAVLGVDDPSTVKVDVGDGSVLLQALSGKLATVDVTASSVTFGDLSGAATVHAEGVPLNADAPTSKLDVTFALPEEAVASQLSGSLSGTKLDSVELQEPNIVVKTTIDLFFFKLPLGMALEPSAEKGKLVFTPTTITLGDQDYTPEQLRKELGDLADGFLAQQSVCVNESLPAALTVVDVDVVKKDLLLKINGDGVVLGGSDLKTPGTCAG